MLIKCLVFANMKLLILLLCAFVSGNRLHCNEQSILLRLRKPTYEFSVRILDRVSHVTDGHFVYSPLSTWLQLLALADGAQGNTLNEIISVTRYHRMLCFRKMVNEIINSLDEELGTMGKRRSVIVIDKLLEVKDSYKAKIEKLNAAKVMSLNFKNKIQSADKVNEIIAMDTNGVITDSVDAQDFNMSVLFMTDTAYMKADWKYPFNPVYTKPEPFYTNENVLKGEVNMMHQIGFFNFTYIPFIKAHALELPFNERVSMIFLLPSNGLASDMFWFMKDIRLMTIYSLFKSNGLQLVNFKVPRFKQTTTIDNIPELLYDMGIKSIFYPHLANLRSLSEYNAFISLMVNVDDIEVTEKGVSGNVGPEFLISPDKDPIDFFLNRPFAYVIADKITDVIIFAGVYTNPSLY
ncbi:serine protease inhibitor 77Ba-like [Epargyreus clarus]|uniref:serine protease inhibitor 77Ba-like n=1 Tax=Epargyreus clarus TaxID=520877 RepID=UPI003C305A88